MTPTLTFIYNEVSEMAKQHEVTVLCTEHTPDVAFPFSKVVEIPFKENTLRRKFVWYSEIKNFFVTRKNNRFKIQIQKFIDEYKPDVIHAHFGYESIKLLDNLASLTQYPIFISFHGYDASQMLSRKAYVNKLNEYFQYPNIIPICVSDFIKKNLLKAGVRIDNAELLYCGINTSFFTPPLHAPAQDVFTFLQISSFNEKKGHLYTLQAFKVFLNTVPNKNKYKLVLAGAWGLFEQIKKETHNLGLTPYVEFTGQVNHQQAKELLSKAHAFIHHSITAKNGDTEGLPNAIIEAMAMELPVLSTYHAGIPELVEDGVNGYLVPEKDVIRFAKRMHDIIEWKRQPKNREKATRFFSNQAHAATLSALYEKHYTIHQQKNINLLHLFGAYPGSNTTNWLYNLITETPQCKVTIAAENYTKHNFYNTTFSYIDNPSASIIQYKNTLKTWSLNFSNKLVCYLTEKWLGTFNKKLEEQINTQNTDIIHAHFADIACQYIDLVKQKQIPFFVSFYGYDYEYLPHIKPEYKQKYKKLFQTADVFLCEGVNGSKILQKMGCPTQKIKIAHLGVEVEKIPFCTKTKKSNTLHLIQIASLRQKKGHTYTLQAFHAALDSCPDMTLTFVGQGESTIYNELKAYISYHNLEQKVTIQHEINFDALHAYLQKFDVFIHPSCYSNDMDCEGGAPIVLLDAQACGLPVIATTHCDIPDEVVHEKTGLLSPEKEVELLTKSIVRFYQMGEPEFQSFSQTARAHVEEHYDIKKNAKQVRQLYSDCLSKK